MDPNLESLVPCAKADQKVALLKFFFFSALVTFGVIAYWALDLGSILKPHLLLQFIEGHGATRVPNWVILLLYGFGYVLATCVGIPSQIFVIGAGGIWGVGPAFLLMTIATQLAALAGFLLARWLGSEGVRQLFPMHSDKWVVYINRGGLRKLILFRAIPILPFNAINFGMGLSQMPLSTFALGNFIACPFFTFIQVLFGSGLRTLSFSDPSTWWQIELLAPLLLQAGLLGLGLAIQPKKADPKTPTTN